MKAFVIAGNELRRLLRDRTAIAMAFVLPILLILVIGGTATSFKPRIALVVEDDAPLAAELASAIHAIDDLDVVDRSRAGLTDDLRRGDVSGGVVIPARYDAALRSGDTGIVEYLSISATAAPDVSGLIEAEVGAQSARVRAARVTSADSGESFDQSLALATQAATAPAVTVVVLGAGGGEPEAVIDYFTWVAAGELLLFVFLTAMASSTLMIQSRRLRVAERMLSTPTRPATIVVGATLGRFLVSLTQALFILVATALVFGVDWGSWPATLLIVVVFVLIGTGAGMLVGTSVPSDQMAYSIGISIGLVFALLAGVMGFTFGDIGRITPHAWALEAFEEVIVRSGTVADVLTELGVLALFAVALVGLATWRFRRSITA